MSTIRVTSAGFTIECTAAGLPPGYDRVKATAELVDEIELQERHLCCVTVRRAGDARPLIVAQGLGEHDPTAAGFVPGVLLAAEAGTLFIGAGKRLLAYRLASPRRLWEDSGEMGFLGWEQHGDVVLMAAELELAAWTVTGDKLWTTFVEPPWGFTVAGELLWADLKRDLRKLAITEEPELRAAALIAQIN